VRIEPIELSRAADATDNQGGIQRREGARCIHTRTPQSFRHLTSNHGLSSTSGFAQSFHGNTPFYLANHETHFLVVEKSKQPMIFNLRKFPLPCMLALAGGLLLSAASAQQFKASVDKPSFDDLQSPEFSGGKQKAFKPKNWLELETKLNLLMSPEPLSKTCDKVTVKWYVAVQNPDKANTYLLLTKEVDHVNVPLGEDVYVSVYLSPSSIKRLTGSDRANKGLVDLVGYEVLINGVKVAEETNKSKPGWWNTGSSKISRSDAVPLLTKMQTPFSHMWWDRYAEVASTNR
jgi:hypothetical protein